MIKLQETFLPFFFSCSPPPDKPVTSRFVHFCNPLQLQPPNYNHMKGQTGHLHLFSGHFFEKITRVLNLFSPTVVSTRKTPDKHWVFRVFLLCGTHFWGKDRSVYAAFRGPFSFCHSDSKQKTSNLSFRKNKLFEPVSPFICLLKNC